MSYDKKHMDPFLANFSDDMREEVIGVYRISLKGHIKQCMEALKKRDAQQLEDSIHDVKSLCYQIDANEAGKLAEEMELSILDDKPDEAFENTALLIEHIQSVVSVLDDMV